MKVHGPLTIAGKEVVSSLPVTDLFTGREVFNSSDNTVYIYYGATWNAITGGGGGAVSSVFGRTGAVIAVSGDYDADEIDDAATTNKFATAAQLAAIATNTSDISTNATAIATKITDPMTTNGDLIYQAGGVPARLGIGTDGQVLTLSSGLPTWQNATGGFTDPMTTRGDIIIRDSSNTTNRLAVGTNGQVLKADGTDIAYGLISNNSIDASAAIDVTKLAAMPASRAVVSDGSGYISASSVTETELEYVSGVTSAIQTQIDDIINTPKTYSIAETTITTASISHWNNATGISIIAGPSYVHSRREGDCLHIIAGYSFTGTGTDSGAFTCDLSFLMSGLTPNMTTSSHYLDTCISFDSGPNTFVVLGIGFQHSGTGTGIVTFYKSSGTQLLGTDVPGDFSFLFFDITIPITEWSASEALDPLTTDGDLVYYDSGVTRLAAGGEAQVLTISSGLPVWATPASGFADPMTTRGDLIYKDASNVTTRLPVGTSSQLLQSDGTDIAWTSPSFAASVLTSGTLADARVAASNVTQHQASLTITESQISDLGAYITGITGEPLSDLSDVTITSIAANEILQWNGSAWINQTFAEAGIGSGDGDVTGPGSSTDNAIARFDSTTGKIIQNSSATIDDSGNLSAANIAATGQIGSAINDAGNSGTSKTIDWDDGNVQFVDMTGNVTFTLSNPVSGNAYTLILKQDATGSRTATWPAAVQWPGGTAPTLSTAANSIDVITLVYNGLDTEYYANSVLDMQ